MTTARAILRYENGSYHRVVDDVLRETALSVYLNGSFLVKLICTPECLDDLVVGFLFSAGLIGEIDDVESITIDESIAQVMARLPAAGERDGDADGIVTDSGDFAGLPAGVRPRVVNAPLRETHWSPQVVLANANRLLRRSALFDKTGNVHSVAICRGADLLYACEDVGRYNAFDKCVGRALRDGADLSDTCVCTTGRIPSSMVRKTIRCGIPMIVSRSAPTDASVALADQYGLTIVGFARGERFNLYADTPRVTHGPSSAAGMTATPSARR